MFPIACVRPRDFLTADGRTDGRTTSAVRSRTGARQRRVLYRVTSPENKKGEMRRRRYGGEIRGETNGNFTSDGGFKVARYETTSIGETLMGSPSARHRRPEGHPRRLHFPSGYGEPCWKYRTPSRHSSSCGKSSFPSRALESRALPRISMRS